MNNFEQAFVALMSEPFFLGSIVILFAYLAWEDRSQRRDGND